MKYIQEFDNFNEKVNYTFTDADIYKIYNFYIKEHKVQVIIQLYDQEDQAYSISYTVDKNHDKSLSLEGTEGISLLTTVRQIIFDFIEKFNPNIITLLPSDKDVEVRNKKERINNLFNIPGFNKEKIGISTVFSKMVKEEFNLKGLITNIKYKLTNPSLAKDMVDIDGNTVYIKIPLSSIKSMDDAEKIVNTANQYQQVKNAYIDGNTSSIMIQAYSDKPIS